MKLGILIKDFNKLANWELRIIHEIINDTKVELSLLIQDGRVESENQKRLKYSLYKLFHSKNNLSKLLLKFQIKLERILFYNKHTVDKKILINYLRNINIVKVNPRRNGFLDIFNEEDTRLIRNYKLDIILKLGFNELGGGILEAANFGIWYLCHEDSSSNRGGPAGFWEIVMKESFVSVTLLQLTPKPDIVLIIDKAYFNLFWSFVKTNNSILEASVSLLLKNIRQLDQGHFSTDESKFNYCPQDKFPSLFFILKYFIHFYSSLLNILIEKIDYKLFGNRYYCWTLFIGKGNFLDTKLTGLKPIELPKDKCWADPFLFKYNNDNYVFFENYSFKNKKGKISCGKLTEYNIVDVTDVLVFDYHLSYPFIFEENGNIFLMPESHENKRLEIYKCLNFPNYWELYSTAFEGETVVDAFFFNDEFKQKWLFVTKQMDPNAPIDCELFIYRVDSIKMDKLTPHKQNPVIIDSRTARNAGAIFKYNNYLFRPSQRNIDGIYGKALNINKITKLTIDEYVEEQLTIIQPDFHNGLIATHHLHQMDEYFAIDAGYRKK